MDCVLDSLLKFITLLASVSKSTSTKTGSYLQGVTTAERQLHICSRIHLYCDRQSNHMHAA